LYLENKNNLTSEGQINDKGRIGELDYTAIDAEERKTSELALIKATSLSFIPLDFVRIRSAL
jgi:hypothetical protein